MTGDEWIKARLEEIELLKQAYGDMPDYALPSRNDRLRELAAEEIMLRKELQHGSTEAGK